jgi:hypothetical protein
MGSGSLGVLGFEIWRGWRGRGRKEGREWARGGSMRRRRFRRRSSAAASSGVAKERRRRVERGKGVRRRWHKRGLERAMATAEC